MWPWQRVLWNCGTLKNFTVPFEETSLAYTSYLKFKTQHAVIKPKHIITKLSSRQYFKQQYINLTADTANFMGVLSPQNYTVLIRLKRHVEGTRTLLRLQGEIQQKRTVLVL